MDSRAVHRAILAAAIASFAVTGLAWAQDWPMWGRTVERNKVYPGDGVPASWSAGQVDADSEAVDSSTTKNVKWVAKLGSQAYGNPVVADGRVYVGTNNQSPRDTKHQGDRGVLMCLDEKSGELIWQFVVPKLGAGKVSDWEFLGICSTPAVDGPRLYLVTNRCEVVCLDVNGLADGNQGFADEASYFAGPGNPPIEPGDMDADILWRYDMRDELGVFPHNISSNSPVVVNDVVWVATSNGVDWSHVNRPAPRAPALIGLNKLTGELYAEEASGVSGRMLHCNWSSPAFTTVEGQPMIVWGGGDGFCYGFDPDPVVDDQGFSVLRELFRIDGNPPHYRFHDGDPSRPIKYATPPGPSEYIATAVISGKHAYIAIGQDPEHGEGVGSLICIDLTKRGTLAHDQAVWSYEGIDRTISTASVGDGLVYMADYAGVLHCLDAKTGRLYWKHDTGAHIWGSTLLADGKVYLGNEDGDVYVFAHGKEKKLINRINMHAPVYSSPIVANGVLYIATQTHLFAIDE